MLTAGYNAIIISTIVDNAEKTTISEKGYNDIIISTIVDNRLSDIQKWVGL